MKTPSPSAGARMGGVARTLRPTRGEDRLPRPVSLRVLPGVDDGENLLAGTLTCLLWRRVSSPGAAEALSDSAVS